MQTWKKAWRMIKPALLIYFIYLLTTSVLIFLKDYEATELYASTIDTSEYYGEGVGPDRAAIIEDRPFALTTRFNLLEQAEESIKIANYSIYPGEVADLFYGLILDAANRGVKVQLLFNGIAHNLYGPTNQTYWALVNHSNIELRFYEPLNLMQPWTLHNRMHDKFWIVDETYALSGGRNIGDKYYLDDFEGASVYDRDVLVYNTDPSSEASVLADFNQYFNQLWTHEYTKAETPNYLTFFQNVGEEGEAKLLANLNEARTNEAYGLGQTIDWRERSYPTRKVSLITNPLQRLKKTPVILETLNALMMEADDFVIAQSPYLVINEELQEILDLEDLEAELHILTNSQYATPNFPAMAGMLKYNERLLNGSTQVYGYQGEGSHHGKSYMIDQQLSLVGSFNLDPRSAFLSTENLVVIDSQPFTQALTENIQSIMEESRVYDDQAPILPESVQPPKEVPGLKQAIINLARLFFAPFDELL